MKRITVKGFSLFLCIVLIVSAMGSPVYAAEKVRLNKTSVTLSVGESVTLKINGSSIKSAKSSNKKVASVNSKGKVTAKKKGKATITITGKNKKKYRCKVSVNSNKLDLDSFVGKTSYIDLTDGEVGLAIYSNGKNYDIYFGRWVEGLSASAEDFYFTTKKGKNKYSVTGNRNKSKYTFIIKRKDKSVEIKVKREKDQWHLIPEKDYIFGTP